MSDTQDFSALLDEFRDISYQTPAYPLHSFDLYLPKIKHTPPPPTICFVHGGAWRSEDKSDHALLARRLASHTTFPVVVPNYRLTKPDSPHTHPTHAQDLLAFLEFLLSWHGPNSDHHTFGRLYLLGHSCSAHMLTSIFLSPPPSSSFSPDALVPSPKLLASTQGIVLSEGIYDIDLLLKSFPTYKEWFVAAAFGDKQSYSDFNTTTYTLRKGGEHIRWLVLHSSGDTLVDVIQSEGMYKHLSSVDNGVKVEFDGISLVAEHNQLLKEDVYPQLVSNFATRESTP